MLSLHLMQGKPCTQGVVHRHQHRLRPTTIWAGMLTSVCIVVPDLGCHSSISGEFVL